MSLAEAPLPMQSNNQEPDRRGDRLERRYDILTPDPQFTNKPTAETLQEDYLDRTAKLIETITGSEDGKPYDSVIFLDKSARPLHWMMRDLWPHVAPERKNPDTGKMETVPMSEFNIKFLNIDRVPWRNEPDKPIAEAGMKPIKPEHVEGLRNIFQTTKKKNVMDGKRVLIVDEQAETGDTLTVAKALLDKAFPTSTFDRYAWMQHPSSGTGPKQKPAWYPVNSKLANGEEDQAGRGVFNPVSYNPRRPDQGPRFIPESYQFLSTKPKRQVKLEDLTTEDTRRYTELASRAQQLIQTDPVEAKRLYGEAKNMLIANDKKSLKLRKEMGQMVMDFAQGNLYPPIRTSRKTILGKSNEKYNRSATEVRSSRPKYR